MGGRQSTAGSPETSPPASPALGQDARPARHAVPALRSTESAEIAALAQEFHLRRRSVRELYEQFREHLEQGFVDKPTFKDILRQSGIDNDEVADHWFEVCDPNGDGKIVFREFLTVVALMEQGSLMDRAEFTFRCYDIDGNGFITREELFEMLLCAYKFIDKLTSHKTKESPEQRAKHAANEAFIHADSNGDDQISLDEFRTWVRENAIFESGMDIFVAPSAAVSALMNESPRARSRSASTTSPRALSVPSNDRRHASPSPTRSPQQSPPHSPSQAHRSPPAGSPSQAQRPPPPHTSPTQ